MLFQVHQALLQAAPCLDSSLYVCRLERNAEGGIDFHYYDNKEQSGGIIKAAQVWGGICNQSRGCEDGAAGWPLTCGNRRRKRGVASFHTCLPTCRRASLPACWLAKILSTSCGLSSSGHVCNRTRPQQPRHWAGGKRKWRLFVGGINAKQHVLGTVCAARFARAAGSRLLALRMPRTCLPFGTVQHVCVQALAWDNQVPGRSLPCLCDLVAIRQVDSQQWGTTPEPDTCLYQMMQDAGVALDEKTRAVKVDEYSHTNVSAVFEKRALLGCHESCGRPRLTSAATPP